MVQVQMGAIAMDEFKWSYYSTGHQGEGIYNAGPGKNACDLKMTNVFLHC